MQLLQKVILSVFLLLALAAVVVSTVLAKEAALVKQEWRSLGEAQAALLKCFWMTCFCGAWQGSLQSVLASPALGILGVCAAEHSHHTRVCESH